MAATIDTSLPEQEGLGGQWAPAPFVDAAAAPALCDKQQGDLAFSEGRHKDAHACYTHALQQRPGDATLLCNRSLVALKLGNFSHAELDAERAVAALERAGAGRRGACPVTCAGVGGSGCGGDDNFDKDASGSSTSVALRLCGGAAGAATEESGQDSHADCAVASQADSSPSPPQQQQLLLVKAFWRQAAAQQAQGRGGDALATLRRALACCGPRRELAAALRLALNSRCIDPQHAASDWAARIEGAEKPTPLSRRDGRLLRLVPRGQVLAGAALEGALRGAFEARPGLLTQAFELMAQAWVAGREPGRAEVAFLRGHAYLQAGNAKQASKDAKVACVYGPLRSGHPCWPQALALASACHGAAGDATQAALAMQEAAECAAAAAGGGGGAGGSEKAGGSEEAGEAKEYYWQQAAELARRLPAEQARALEEGGSCGLRARLVQEAEDALPPVLRPRPKYSYYYEWTTQRIARALADGGFDSGGGGGSGGLRGGECGGGERLEPCGLQLQLQQLQVRSEEQGGGQQEGALPPQPVLDKLLAMDAGELDLLLRYPVALGAHVQRLQTVLGAGGEEALATYAPPLLEWDDVQNLAVAGGGSSSVSGSSRQKMLIGLGLENEPTLEDASAPPGLLLQTAPGGK